MGRRRTFWSLALLCAVGSGLLSGCSLGPESGGHSQSTPARQTAVAIEGQEKGRGYFLRECGACHRHFWPQERSVAQWQTILAKKKTKVSLTGVQFQQLSDYVIQASARASVQP